MEHTIDATNKILGRLATEVAILLRGKNIPSFHPATLPRINVMVYNTDRIRVTGRKMKQKLYRRHSGYHGGLKETKLETLMKKDSCRVLQYAVMGMLPKNRSRKKILRHLKLIKGEIS